MTSTPDKAAAPKERFDAVWVPDDLTPADMRKLGSSPDGLVTLHGIAKAAGITKEDHDAVVRRLRHDMSASKFAVLGGLAGGSIAAAGLPLVQLAKTGRSSWQAFAEAAPKTTAIGVVVGAIVGVAGTIQVNRTRREERRLASAEWDNQEAAWAKREAERKSTTSPSQSAGEVRGS